MQDCLFCKIERGEIPSKKVYEDEHLYVIEDINPQAPIHLLIIPRTHHPTVMDIEEDDQQTIGSVFTVAAQLAKKSGLDDSGFRVILNCGAGAGQSVFHIHYHLLGGRAFTWPPG